MLGDAAGFAGHHVGVADRVEQRGLAVVDVAHDGHDRRARLGIGRNRRRCRTGLPRRRTSATRLTVWPNSSAISWAVSASITSVIFVHLALLHQQADHVDRALGHAVGEFLDGDRFRDRSPRASSFSFGSFEAWPFRRWVRRRNEAIERSRTSSALSAVTSVRRPRCFCGAGLRGRSCGGSRGARRRRRGRGGPGADLRPRRLLSAATPATRAAVPGARRSRRRRASALGFAEALLGFGFGLALGFLVLAVALFLGLAARFGGFALGLLDAFACCCGAWLLLRRGGALRRRAPCVGQRAGARRTFVLGQRAQHHAGAAARRAGGAGRAQRGASARRRPGAAASAQPRAPRLGRVAGRRGASALLDHDRLGAAMAEALAHGARLDARLERQGLLRDAQRLVARRSWYRPFSSPNPVALCVPHRLSASARRFLAGIPAVLSASASGIGQGIGCATGTLARRAREQGSMYHI